MLDHKEETLFIGCDGSLLIYDFKKRTEKKNMKEKTAWIVSLYEDLKNQFIYVGYEDN